MKTIKEWREDINQHENVELLLDRLVELTDQAQTELESFTGDRPDGFLDLCGAVKELKRKLVSITSGTVNDVPKFLSQRI